MNVSMRTGGIGYVENTDLGCEMIAIPYKMSKKFVEYENCVEFGYEYVNRTPIWPRT